MAIRPIPAEHDPWYGYGQDLDAEIRTGRLSDTGLRAAFVPVQQAKLGKWYAALGARDTSRAQIVVFGDSITQGSGAATITGRWQTLLQKRLRGSLGVSGGADLPFIPAYSDMSDPAPQVVRAGAVDAVPYGFASHAAQLTDATSTITFTFTGTRCTVMFMEAFAGGVARVVIDGGTAQTVNTDQGSLLGGGVLIDSGTLTAGTHTVVVTRDASSASGKVILLEGLLTYNGDLTSGVRVLDAGRFGGASDSPLQVPQFSAQSLAVAGGAGLGIYAYGTNDVGTGIPAATFKANAAALIAAMRADGQLGSVLYLAMYKAGDGRSDATWNPYVTALRELADADPDGIFLDLGDRMPDAPASGFTTNAYGLFHDVLHPSPAGHGWIADVLASVILPH